MQVAFELADGQEREIVFRLGAASNADAAGQLVQRFRGSAAAREALEAVVGHWRHTLGAVHVETPDAALNVLANGWLVYQTMACRLWARSGYYQSGGAYGFRDQLQDVMALVHAEPSLVRAQIALCASRQFVEGDVQHWWHPPSGRGVRTHCSDDYLWLPLATCRYVLTTGDTAILDETAHFLEGRPVNAEDDSYYDLPGRSDESANVYQHCVRAIEHGLRFGAHGLPLIGSGDWNDGMNLVGRHGKGESVWLAFFLYHVLGEFAKLARLRDDPSFADRCETEALQLRQRSSSTPGMANGIAAPTSTTARRWVPSTNPECQIDSVPQSWSVLSGAGDAERSRRAMDAVDARLVRRDHALIQLLDPPFDTSDLDPGYIRGYVPGVRENGGQYTHARDLDGDGVRGAGRQRARVGIDGDDQPGESRANAGRRCDLQGGALCRRRRRLCARAAHGPRRMDLVHGLGRLDVPARRGVAAGAQAGSGSPSFRAVPARGVEGVHAALPVSRNLLPHHGAATGCGRRRGDSMRRALRSMASRRKATSFFLSTIGGNTGSRYASSPRPWLSK